MSSQVRIEEHLSGTIIHLNGQFVGGDETMKLKEILQSMSEKQTTKLIINLDKTSYLNSTALGILISAHANFTKREAKIVLCNVSQSIKNIFVITKLAMVFSLADTLEEAIQKISE